MLAAAVFATGALLHGSAASRGAVRGATTAVRMSGVYDFSARDLRTGNVQELSEYEGKVSLVVNVASK